MTILFEAWRRAHEKEPRLAETLGAPTDSLRARTPLLPWLLCLLLVACVAGLGVYIWLDWGLLHGTAAKTSPPTASVPAATPSHVPVTRPQAGSAKRTAVTGSPASASVHSTPATAVPMVKPPAEKSAGSKAGSAQPSRNAAAAATLSLAAVPDDIREALPSLAVVAHVWNANPAARFIMIGGHVFRVGDELSPGLRLLAITRDGEIVAFRGYHIALP